MSDDINEQDYWEDECDDEGSCEYGVSEFCCDPQTRDMGLCTTECVAYLDAVEADARAAKVRGAKE